MINVDDDVDNGDIFARAVRDIDPSIKCVILPSGTDLLEYLKKESAALPDLIFLDINMPGMDGKECLIEMRRINGLKHIPVIMFSTYISEKDVAIYQRLHASCLQKPSDFPTLKSRLKFMFGLASSV